LRNAPTAQPLGAFCFSLTVLHDRGSWRQTGATQSAAACPARCIRARCVKATVAAATSDSGQETPQEHQILPVIAGHDPMGRPQRDSFRRENAQPCPGGDKERRGHGPGAAGRWLSRLARSATTVSAAPTWPRAPAWSAPRTAWKRSAAGSDCTAPAGRVPPCARNSPSTARWRGATCNSPPAPPTANRHLCLAACATFVAKRT
jgi:hypothetical protein